MRLVGAPTVGINALPNNAIIKSKNCKYGSKNENFYSEIDNLPILAVSISKKNRFREELMWDKLIYEAFIIFFLQNYLEGIIIKTKSKYSGLYL